MIALVKLFRIADTETYNRDGWKDGRTIWRTSDLKLGPAGADVRIDHDEDKQIGRVLELSSMGWSDGGRWIVARCELDTVPDWLKRGTKASCGYHDFNAGRDVTGLSLLQEVSLLSPGRTPVEPGAEVVLLERLPARPTSSNPTGAAGEVIHGGPPIKRLYQPPITVREQQPDLTHHEIYDQVSGHTLLVEL